MLSFAFHTSPNFVEFVGATARIDRGIMFGASVDSRSAAIPFKLASAGTQ